MDEFKLSLHKAGFKQIVSSSLSKVRTLYFDLDSTIADFNLDQVSKSIKKVWNSYLRITNVTLFNNLNQSVLALDQSLFYDFNG